MREWINTPAILIALAIPVLADTKATFAFHEEAYYNYGVSVPARDSTVEYWIDQGRMAVLTETGTTILDVAKSLLIVIDRERSAYYEIKLPWQSAAAAPGIADYFRFDKSGGTVTPSVRADRIDGRACSVHRVNDWREEDGSRFEERTEDIWMSAEVPFDLGVYQAWTSALRGIIAAECHWEKEYVEDLKRLPGFPLGRESVISIKGVSHRQSQMLIAMSERESDPGLYVVPSGFRRIETPDLRIFDLLAYGGGCGILDP